MYVRKFVEITTIKENYTRNSEITKIWKIDFDSLLFCGFWRRWCLTDALHWRSGREEHDSFSFLWKTPISRNSPLLWTSLWKLCLFYSMRACPHRGRNLSETESPTFGRHPSDSTVRMALHGCNRTGCTVWSLFVFLWVYKWEFQIFDGIKYRSHRPLGITLARCLFVISASNRALRRKRLT